MSDESGNQRPAASASASGSIGSLHTPTATPAGRLTSLRGGRGGAGASTASTRGGASKLKFAPTVPSKRNKKDASLSLLEEAKAGSGPEERGTGRGRGERGERGMRGGRGGRGPGRGRPDDVAATASGPFSLGPAAQARSRAIATGGSASGAHSSYTGSREVKLEGEGGGSDYGASVDMKFGSTVTDASVPTGLEKPNEDTKVVASSIKDEKMREQDMDEETDVEGSTHAAGEADIKPKVEGPAQDLSPESEYDQMFFFQFPSVMPTFRPRPVATAPISSITSTAASSPNVSSLYSTPDGTDKTEDSEDGLLAIKAEPTDQDRPIMIPDNDLVPVKSEQKDVKLGLSLGDGTPGSSAPVGQRAKPKASGAAAAKTTEKEEETEDSHLQQEGKIGRLLIYKSGKVKMKVGDILMDVSSGSECSFLQDLVVVDSNNKQAFVMGSVQKRMVCVPNLTELLNGLEGLDI
ncbi:MAG: RNA polymerase III RPC4-domain-containing protein [Linnemannia elongata]|nr:MAG: RNA polymerase III RPC4-domain-containing protein [Linnemannia elongata]